MSNSYDFPNYLFHPYWGYGYQAWSGILSDLGELTLIASVIVIAIRVYRHFECHVESPKNCHRLGYTVSGTGHRACHEHHPHAEEKGSITAEDILRHHEESGA